MCSFLVTTLAAALLRNLTYVNFFQQMRGPDGTSILHAADGTNGYTFVHNLLSQTQTFLDSGGATWQPFQEGRIFAVFNGEIYNY
ncbi:unnamed protein product, partial [Amoebophrya sp. A25]|eukprot:GSA25T00026544001.1